MPIAAMLLSGFADIACGNSARTKCAPEKGVAFLHEVTLRVTSPAMDVHMNQQQRGMRRPAHTPRLSCVTRIVGEASIQQKFGEGQTLADCMIPVNF